MPGYILPSQNMLIIGYGCRSHMIKEYEVLVSDHPEYLNWRKASFGMPLRPVTCGYDGKGTKDYQQPLRIQNSDLLGHL